MCVCVCVCVCVCGYSSVKNCLTDFASFKQVTNITIHFQQVQYVATLHHEPKYCLYCDRERKGVRMDEGIGEGRDGGRRDGKDGRREIYNYYM